MDMQESGTGVLVLSGYHNAGVAINLIVQRNALSVGCSHEGSRLCIITALRLRVALMFTSRSDFVRTGLAKSKLRHWDRALVCLSSGRGFKSQPQY